MKEPEINVGIVNALEIAFTLNAKFLAKGWAVRPLKWHASWVQNVVRQCGLYLSWAYEICVALTLVREYRVGLTSGLPVVPPGALPGI